MTEHLGNHIPKDCRASLAIDKTRRENLVIILLTVDEDRAFSRVCLLSPYQVISTSPSDLYLEVYQGSHTERNLDRTGKGEFILQGGKGLLYVRGLAKHVGKERTKQSTKISECKEGSAAQQQTLYHFTVVEVLRDEYKSAPINSQMKFDISKIGVQYRNSLKEMREKVTSLL